MHPGPVNPPHHDQEPGGTRGPTVHGAVPITVPFRGSAPVRGTNVNATARRSVSHRNSPRRGDKRPIARYTRNNAMTDQRHLGF